VPILAAIGFRNHRSGGVAAQRVGRRPSPSQEEPRCRRPVLTDGPLAGARLRASRLVLVPSGRCWRVDFCRPRWRIRSSAGGPDCRTQHLVLSGCANPWLIASSQTPEVRPRSYDQWSTLSAVEPTLLARLVADVGLLFGDRRRTTSTSTLGGPSESAAAILGMGRDQRARSGHKTKKSANRSLGTGVGEHTPIFTLGLLGVPRWGARQALRRAPRPQQKP